MRPDPYDGFAVDGGGLALDAENVLPPTGPHDGDGLEPEFADAAGLVDFGSLRVPVPAQGTVTVEPTAGDRMQAVHISLPEGRLSVSALAAPKSSKLWPELAGEIDASLREGGARVRSFPGEWGRELHATSGGASTVFVGVDGPRWMVYGVATGPSGQAAPLDAELRRMLRGTVVVRGKQPYPVRTILPLTMPEHLAAEAASPAAATKKRVPAKGGAARSAPGNAAPGRTAPGKTAPPNSDAGTAAAKKAAARRAAARKAAAAAAVKAAAEALAEHAAQDRAEAAEPPDTGTARGARTGAYPPVGTIPTGPGPDAPLREQAPSARRAAAAAWRSRPVAPPPTEAFPAARPIAEPPAAEAPPATEALPIAPAARPDLPPTEALPVVEPGSGGRRRLQEPGAPPPPAGRRHLQEPPVDELGPGGRRRLREPAPELPPPTGGYHADPPGGRRRLREPKGAIGATAPWAVGGPDGPREPVAGTGVSASGRRRLREPGEQGAVPPADPFAAPGPAGRRASVFDTGVSASDRRRLRESWEPSEPGPDAGVSATGRRRLRESWDDAGPRREAEPGGAPPAFPGAAADTGVSASGRRRLREPWERQEQRDELPPRDARAGSIRPTGPEGPDRSRPPWEGAVPDAPLPDVPVPDVSATGRRRQPGSWEGAGASSWGSGPGGAADDGVSGTGRRRLRESWEGAGASSWESGPGGAADDGVSGTGRRRLRESWEGAGASSWEPGPGATAEGGVSGTGRRRLRESWDAAGADPGRDVGPSGRRHLREPWEPAASDGVVPGRRLREPGGAAGPDPVEPVGRRHLDAGVDPLSGTGGRRRLREPERAPVGEGPRTQPWTYGPLERGARSAERLPETGERSGGWGAPEDHGARRDGGRHSGADDGSPTVRLEALLRELDPNRPRRRHRR